jgi:hypothetical protein
MNKAFKVIICTQLKGSHFLSVYVDMVILNNFLQLSQANLRSEHRIFWFFVYFILTLQELVTTDKLSDKRRTQHSFKLLFSNEHDGIVKAFIFERTGRIRLSCYFRTNTTHSFKLLFSNEHDAFV